MTPVWWRGRPSASRVGYRACEAAGGLNPQARTAKSEADRAKKCVGSFDAVAIAAGEVAFAPLSEFTAEKWQFSLGSKLMGQINLVQEAIPLIKEKGSFTLVSGILNDEPIFAGVAASTVSGALEAFVRAAAIELPKMW